MSFDYNPLQHIEVVNDNGIRISCHGCGGTRPRPSDPGLPLETPAAELFKIMRDHVTRSHERSDADFEGWPLY